MWGKLMIYLYILLSIACISLIYFGVLLIKRIRAEMIFKKTLLAPLDYYYRELAKVLNYYDTEKLADFLEKWKGKIDIGNCNFAELPKSDQERVMCILIVNCKGVSKKVVRKAKKCLKS